MVKLKLMDTIEFGEFVENEALRYERAEDWAEVPKGCKPLPVVGMKMCEKVNEGPRLVIFAELEVINYDISMR